MQRTRTVAHDTRHLRTALFAVALLASSMLTPVADHTFRVETADGYGVPGELVVFELDPAGRVKRVRFGENSSERIETWEDR